MNSYIILLRGVNVGGKNKISMAELKQHLEKQGFMNVATYIQSGNIVLRSKLGALELAATIERLLARYFKLDSSIIRVLALDHEAYKAVVKNAPKNFGEDPTNYRYDVIFLMGISADEAMRQIAVHEGVDAAWPGNSVVYYRRPSLTSPNATKSHLGKIAAQPIYASITIRNWNTTQKLVSLLEASTER